MRHTGWVRSEGLARLVEEDNLHVLPRIKQHRARAKWRRSHPRPPGAATPVFVVGLQRSGTNMVVRGFERAPEFEVHNENDSTVFHRFRLRDDAVVRRVILRSRQEFVLFKPLCDSHRTPELLDLHPGPAAHALWIYRDVDRRTASAVRKFGDAALRALQTIDRRGYGDRGHAGDLWQAGGLQVDDLEFIRAVKPQSLDAVNAAALLWYLRNRLFFTLELDRDPRTHLVSYDRFLLNPQGTMRRMCASVGFTYREDLVKHVQPTRNKDIRVELIPPIRSACDALAQRLDDVARTASAG